MTCAFTALLHRASAACAFADATSWSDGRSGGGVCGVLTLAAGGVACALSPAVSDVACAFTLNPCGVTGANVKLAGVSGILVDFFQRFLSPRVGESSDMNSSASGLNCWFTAYLSTFQPLGKLARIPE